MTAAIDFYFDFSSPYGFIGSEKIEALAARHGRKVAWHPVLLGVADAGAAEGRLLEARFCAQRPVSWRDRLPDADGVSDFDAGAGAHRRLAAAH
jgi:hypothetical protein